MDQEKNFCNIEKSSSILKFDMPIGQMKFFVNSIILLIIQLFIIGFYIGLYSVFKTPMAFIILISIFSLLFGIPLVYLNFINYAKRLWDIIGNRKTALGITFVILILTIISTFVPLLSILLFLIYLILIFKSGKQVAQQ